MQIGYGVELQIQVALQNFRRCLTDTQPAKVLQIWQSFKEQRPFDNRIGVLHFINRFAVLVVSQLMQPQSLSMRECEKY